MARVGPAGHALGCGGTAARRSRSGRCARYAGPDGGGIGECRISARVVARRRPVVCRRPRWLVESSPLARRRAPLHVSSPKRIRQAVVAIRDDHVRIRRARLRGVHVARRRRMAPRPARFERRDDRDSPGVDEHRLPRRRRLDRGFHRRRAGSERRGGEPRPRIRRDASAPHIERALDRRPVPVTPRRAHLPHRQRRRGVARLLLSAEQRVVSGAGRRIPAVAGDEPWRSDRGNQRHP